jgi:hypothetical protein
MHFGMKGWLDEWMEGYGIAIDLTHDSIGYSERDI